VLHLARLRFEQFEKKSLFLLTNLHIDNGDLLDSIVCFIFLILDSSCFDLPPSKACFNFEMVKPHKIMNSHWKKKKCGVVGRLSLVVFI
jgi:hypothetical protein